MFPSHSLEGDLRKMRGRYRDSVSLVTLCTFVVRTASSNQRQIYLTSLLGRLERLNPALLPPLRGMRGGVHHRTG